MVLATIFISIFVLLSFHHFIGISIMSESSCYCIKNCILLKSLLMFCWYWFILNFVGQTFISVQRHFKENIRSNGLRRNILKTLKCLFFAWHGIFLWNKTFIKLILMMNLNFVLCNWNFDIAYNMNKFINHREKTFFRYYLSSAVWCVCVCVFLCVYVCLCGYGHTVKPRTLKLWHNIPYVNI